MACVVGHSFGNLVEIAALITGKLNDLVPLSHQAQVDGQTNQFNRADHQYREVFPGLPSQQHVEKRADSDQIQ